MILLPLLIFLSLSCNRAQHCDLIELNHFHDQRGCRVYSQVILWGINPANGKFVVRAWYLVHDDDTRWPTKADSGLHEARWDGNRVVSRMFRESWTQRDPELDNRNVWDVEERVSFFKEVQ